MSFRNILEKFSDPGFKTKRFKVILTLCFLAYVILVAGLDIAWYSNQKTESFHFFNDWPEWKQLDKFAHLFWTFQACALATRLLGFAQLRERSILFGGTILGFIFVSSIEIGDGFSEHYGASVFDILANATGSILFVSQRLLFREIRIWPKFSFHPTSFAPLRPEILGNNLLTEILKDYNGQTFWYSVRFKKLPLPSWLTIAVGVGAEGMVYGRDAQNEIMGFSPYRKFFLSVDLDLTHYRSSSKILNSVMYGLNIIKFPAPAIEFSLNGIKFHPIYF